MFLFDDLLIAPLKGLVWLAGKVDEVANKELSDEDRVKNQLLELQLQFELDEISEEEYTQRETELLDRLNAIREEQQNEGNDHEESD